jgi:signal transduction histidine kinase
VKKVLCENVTAGIEHVTQEAMLRQREAELQRENERLDEFASLVSHDLRNPLNVADGHLELAAAACDSPHIDEATRALDRMGTLIDDVLALAREGETVNDAELIDLSTVAERCWANVETEAADLRIVDDLTVVADERRVARLFENLFRNAVEHGSTDGIDPTVDVGAITGDTRGFYVQDDGPGIDPERRERVFEAGHSTDGGTGFGLRIVRDIVDAHGWDIECTEGTTGGARFEITGVDVR